MLPCRGGSVGLEKLPCRGGSVGLEKDSRDMTEAVGESCDHDGDGEVMDEVIEPTGVAGLVVASRVK